MNAELTSRRSLLKLAGMAGAATLLPGLAFADGRKGKVGRKRLLRVAHFTDSHVHHDGPGGKWLGKALEHANNLTDKPSLILFGGDMVFDGPAVDASNMASQWAEFKGVMNNSNDIPVQYCIGNHDIWGWNLPSADVRHPQYGKSWALETLEMTHPYYSFDKSGWHFVVLDSVAKHHHGYIGRLGHEQLEWLAQDLSQNCDRPTMILSHIPLLSACCSFFGDSEQDGNRWHVPGALMHIDSRHTKNLFLKHPSVRLALSGHIHLVDRVDYNGVSYLCNGSVAGNWWQGPFQETPPGYTLMDLYDDGTWHREYVKYGWQPIA